MNKKFVGKILPNIMELVKGDMDKKQDQMGVLSADDVKDMYPPFSVKEELSKSAPVQITLLDADSQPITSTEFTVKKSNTVLTSGKTNSSGICVYNEPKVMTCNVTPFTLEYNNTNVEIDTEYANSTYILFNVKTNIDGTITTETVDTDGNILPTHALFMNLNTFKEQVADGQNITLDIYPSENDAKNNTNMIASYSFDQFPDDIDNSSTDLYVLRSLRDFPFINVNEVLLHGGYFGKTVYKKIDFPEGSDYLYSMSELSYSAGYLSDFINYIKNGEYSALSSSQIEYILTKLPDGITANRVLVCY